jgi:hypothetical protein
MAGGEGLDQIERDQICCTLADLDAGPSTQNEFSWWTAVFSSMVT